MCLKVFAHKNTFLNPPITDRVKRARKGTVVHSPYCSRNLQAVLFLDLAFNFFLLTSSSKFPELNYGCDLKLTLS